MADPSPAELDAAFRAAMNESPPTRPRCRAWRMRLISRRLALYVATDRCDRPAGHAGDHAIHWRA